MASSFAGIKKHITDFCHELCPGLDPNHAFSALHLGSVESFATDLAPFVGAISAGGKAVAGLDKATGVVEQSWSAMGGLAKVMGAPGAIKDSSADRIDAWFGKPEKPPKVDKSRIVGLGST